MNQRSRIRTKVLELAAECGQVNATVEDDDIIPEKGILDSASIIELVTWIEREWKLMLDEDEITIANLGSIALIDAFIDGKTRPSSGA